MVYVLLGNGFEEMEAIAPIDLMRRAGIGVTTVGLNGSTILGSHKIPVTADITIEELDDTDAEMVVLPGGLGGVTSCRACPKALEVLRRAWENERFVAAICAGPTVLADLGITDGKDCTCYPSCAAGMGSANVLPGLAAVRDGRLITGTSAGCATTFALELIAALKGDDAAEQVAKQIVIR